MYEEGYRYTIINDIVDRYNLASEIDKYGAYISSPRGHDNRNLTTTDWELLVNCKDVNQSWVPLKCFKDCYLIDVLEYTT